ncbi:PQQ-binding-like beta-propeller repeat protein [Nocardioides sp.]|uniref:outer membrane protein assembly factor BamB family protein n=1 Tax=Nocardioides sp. TaxID=35761 RepID=UPI0035280C04
MPAVEASGGRPRWVLPVLAGVVAMLLVGGALAWTLRGGSGSGYTSSGYDRTPLVRAVTSEPEEAWSWTGAGDGIGVRVHGGDSYVSDFNGDSAELVALDKNGEERWRVSDSVGGYVSGLSDDGDILLLSAIDESGGITAIDTSDGSTLWSDEVGYVGQVRGKIFWFFDGSTLGIADVETGEQQWSEPSDNFALDGDTMFVQDGRRLSAMDLDSGDELWTADLPGVDEDTYPTVVATDGLVAVSVHGDVTAYDARKGTELWHQSIDEDRGDSLSYGGPGLVMLEEYADSDSYTDGRARFFDRDGSRGTVSIDVDDYSFNAVGISSGAGDYIVDTSSGTVYDDQLEPVSRVPGTVYPVDGGLYSADGDDVGFYRFDESRRSWHLSVGSASGDEGDTYLIPVDGALLTVSGGTLTRYE